MYLSPAYLQARAAAVEEKLQRGLQAGRSVERRLTVETSLKLRFGSIDETLSQVIESLQQLPSDESLPLILQLSREELLVRFGKSDETPGG